MLKNYFTNSENYEEDHYYLSLDLPTILHQSHVPYEKKYGIWNEWLFKTRLD